MSIIVENLTYIYGKDSPMESLAVDNVSLRINDGEIVGIIGHTGSGKSTLIQHFNGLLFPTSGKVIVDNVEISKKINMKEVRQKVGLVFQYPEHQLFEETVYKDIAFGPKNIGLPDSEILIRVREAMDTVSLPYEQYKDISPFELSGGQMRRVALAGVLAMHPSVLVLDEPTAGQDPHNRDEILNEIKKLNLTKNMTIVIVSHSMEDLAKIVGRLIVLKKGKIILEGTPRDVFSKEEILHEAGLGIPQITSLMQQLHKRIPNVNDNVLTVREAYNEILKCLNRG